MRLEAAFPLDEGGLTNLSGRLLLPHRLRGRLRCCRLPGRRRLLSADLVREGGEMRSSVGERDLASRAPEAAIGLLTFSRQSRAATRRARERRAGRLADNNAPAQGGASPVGARHGARRMPVGGGGEGGAITAASGDMERAALRYQPGSLPHRRRPQQ